MHCAIVLWAWSTCVAFLKHPFFFFQLFHVIYVVLVFFSSFILIFTSDFSSPLLQAVFVFAWLFISWLVSNRCYEYCCQCCVLVILSTFSVHALCHFIRLLCLYLVRHSFTWNPKSTKSSLLCLVTITGIFGAYLDLFAIQNKIIKYINE